MTAHGGRSTTTTTVRVTTLYARKNYLRLILHNTPFLGLSKKCRRVLVTKWPYFASASGKIHREKIHCGLYFDGDGGYCTGVQGCECYHCYLHGVRCSCATVAIVTYRSVYFQQRHLRHMCSDCIPQCSKGTFTARTSFSPGLYLVRVPPTLLCSTR